MKQNQEQSTGISDSEPVERGKTESDNRNIDKTSQSEHRNTDREPETLDSYNVGNGFSTSESEHLGRGRQQPNDS